MAGYWNNPEATAEAITPDGWFQTGDAGYLDDEGFVYLHDRVKDMIVSGGENVYPAEVENVAGRAPGGRRRRRDRRARRALGRGGQGHRRVRRRRERRARPRPSIIAFARERLAGYKLPKSVDFAEVLPRNPSGKLLKRELREPYWAGRDRQVG